MSESSLTVQVPGKLMIAGEFAVLENYQTLVAMAVDRFVYATIDDSRDNRLTLESYGLYKMPWAYEARAVHVKTADKRTRFVAEAMTTVYTYLQEQGITPEPFHLAVRSELADASGRKYGLGSSAAVVTSVVAAMLHRFWPEEPADALIFKLAALSHVMTQKGGSGADVAASSFGGWLEYASFQASWLREASTRFATISELVNADWPYFSAQPLELPDTIYLCIGWTGSPASTPKLVDKILRLQESDPDLYQQFLTDSADAVGRFTRGIREADPALIMDGARQNRQALAAVGRQAGAPVETPLLTTLCDLAEAHGGAGKPSGAGGGDCGIAFMPSKAQADALMAAWEEAGIQPLALRPNATGATRI
ncbi:phosphomevalonate kinase [Barrientosiimonas marina]|uniref:phosphomevalonate kinase n=1 Tax=Lentibacillus kimchii TaxID=1542911 RepID=A0ABW2UVV8_9BACI